MDILSCQEAFGAADVTSRAMQKAVQEWFDLYFQDKPTDKEDPCQRIPYTIVNKLTKTVFSGTDCRGCRLAFLSLPLVRCR